MISTLRKIPFPIIALSITAFCVGTTEYVIVGLLPDIARSFILTVPQVGWLVTLYALTVVIFGPVITILTHKLEHRTTLLMLLGFLIIGNMLSALAPTFHLLLLARIITALCHGTFFGLSTVVATELVPKNKQTQAVSLIIAGLTIANITGVPIGNTLALWYGWRFTFWAVVFISVIAWLVLLRALPKHSTTLKMKIWHEFRSLKNPQVILAMMTSVLSSASLFSVFTYIAPLLFSVTHLSENQLSGTLFAFGCGLTVGNFIGGWAASRWQIQTIIFMLSSIIITLIGFMYTVHFTYFAIATIFLWSTLAFALISPLQTRVVQLASSAPNLASTFNQSAFHLGNSLGSWISGLAIMLGIQYQHLPAIGAVLAALALGAGIMAWRIERKTSRQLIVQSQ